MPKILLILCFAVIGKYAYSQNPGNVFGPSSYKCDVSYQYKLFYKSPGKLDSMTKPQASTAKRVWRIIDFKEMSVKSCFTSDKSCEYSDLFEIMKFGVLTGKINAFSTDKFDANVLKYKIDIKKFQSLINLKDTVKETSFDSDGNASTSEKIIERMLNSNDLVGYLFCEDWYFDSHWSQMEKRIIFIAPIYKNEKTQTEYPLFYLYYNECRDLLSSFKAVNRRGLDTFTYDELILSHQYPSFVVKTNNVFNRSISDYKRGSDNEDEHHNSLKNLHNSESDLFNR